MNILSKRMYSLFRRYAQSCKGHCCGINRCSLGDVCPSFALIYILQFVFIFDSRQQTSFEQNLKIIEIKLEWVLKKLLELTCMYQIPMQYLSYKQGSECREREVLANTRLRFSGHPRTVYRGKYTL